MTVKEKHDIKRFVQNWMKSHEEDTFIKNEYGNYIYSSGASSINLVCFFEDIIEDYLEEMKL